MDARAMNASKSWENLATAIVKQAIMDYENGLKVIKKKKEEGSKQYVEGLRILNSSILFFKSQWFEVLANCDGMTLKRKLDENFQQYGKCTPFIKNLNLFEEDILFEDVK